MGAGGKGSGPVLYSDVGKQARDLLQKGFSAGHMLMLSYLAPNGATVSTTATMLEGTVVGVMSCSLKRDAMQAEVSASNLCQITANTTYDEVIPGLKVSLSTAVPGAVNSGKTHLQYFHDRAALTATLNGFKAKPSMEVSANFGTSKLTLGGSLVYDPQSNRLIGSTAGLGFFSPDVSGALLVDPKNGKSVDLYCSQALNKKVAWACHLNHKLDRKLTTAMLGTSYKMDNFTTIKSRVDNHGMLAALLQYEPNPLINFGMYAEVNTKALKTTRPKVGFTLTVLAAAI
ncbi:hypothetical protein SELMODRAFT_161680 [Selaginella moellendorffii]|uniref:Uncharacterized protein n=1 Tax=Selaginella moellendorffii TaxID=88036 RepID=D8T793_SELML|nr:mitochondrial outer membrane protein porin 1 [Selaginella moellendorffii]EFJ07578.1 hypothetical protein SELMODRAFT_161680 [Selaginella moellendorffii]|eukprot:XP_002991466.1 mitochondrial outer membrane protein porin 1 [Selaginella moellendorffii]